MSSELSKNLNKLASHLERAVSIEAEVERVNKIAHMISAINGLSILKEAAISFEPFIHGAYLPRTNLPSHEAEAGSSSTTYKQIAGEPKVRKPSFIGKIKKNIRDVLFGESGRTIAIPRATKRNIQNIYSGLQEGYPFIHETPNIEDQISSLKKQYEEKLLEAQEGSTLAKLEAKMTQEKIKDLEGKSRKLEEAIGTASKRLRTSRAIIDRLEGEVSRLAKENIALKARAALGDARAAEQLAMNEARLDLAQNTIDGLKKQLSSVQRVHGSTAKHLRASRAMADRLQNELSRLSEENKILRARAALGDTAAAAKFRDNLATIENLTKQLAESKGLIEELNRAVSGKEKHVQRLMEELSSTRKILASEQAKSLFRKFLESPLRTKALVVGAPLAALGLTGYGAYELGKKRKGKLFNI
ncbi:MAG: hypothetical protein ABIM30_00355 [candidate division WOR-3 bacterium]